MSSLVRYAAAAQGRRYTGTITSPIDAALKEAAKYWLAGTYTVQLDYDDKRGWVSYGSYKKE